MSQANHSRTAGSASSALRRRHMARSSLLVMGAFVVSKIVGLARDRAIAFQFGAGSELDAYTAAFRIPDLLFALFAGGALISAFLPMFSDALESHSSEAEDESRDESSDDERSNTTSLSRDARAWDLASSVTNIIFIFTALLAALSAYFALPLIEVLIAPQFTAQQQALSADLMRIILISTLIFALSGIQMGILNAFQHFLTPALAPILYNLGILGGALFLAPRHGVRGLAWGVVLGAFLHLVVKLPALYRWGYRHRFRMGWRDPAVRRVFWLMIPRVLGMATVQAVFILNSRLASGLTEGSLSALNYAWILAQMPQTILGTAIAQVAFPTLAELASQGDRDGLRRTALNALEVMITLSLPAAVGLTVLGGPAIDLLLRTGRFDAQAAAATELALQMYAIGLVGHVAFEIIARLFYAQKDTWTPLYLSVIALAINIPLAYLWLEPLQQGGLALANSVAVIAEVLIGLAWLSHRLEGMGLRRLFDVTARTALASLAMGVSIVAMLSLIAPRLESFSAERLGSCRYPKFLSAVSSAAP